MMNAEALANRCTCGHTFGECYSHLQHDKFMAANAAAAAARAATIAATDDLVTLLQRELAILQSRYLAECRSMQSRLDTAVERAADVKRINDHQASGMAQTAVAMGQLAGQIEEALKVIFALKTKADDARMAQAVADRDAACPTCAGRGTVDCPEENGDGIGVCPDCMGSGFKGL